MTVSVMLFCSARSLHSDSHHQRRMATGSHGGPRAHELCVLLLVGLHRALQMHQFVLGSGPSCRRREALLCVWRVGLRWQWVARGEAYGQTTSQRRKPGVAGRLVQPGDIASCGHWDRDGPTEDRWESKDGGHADGVSCWPFRCTPAVSVAWGREGGET